MTQKPIFGLEFELGQGLGFGVGLNFKPYHIYNQSLGFEYSKVLKSPYS